MESYALQRRNGHAEVLGNVLERHAAGQQLFGCPDRAVCQAFELDALLVQLAN